MTRTQTASADQDDACRRPAVAVVGAGVSGLAAAWLLQRNGFRVTLFEASPELGGHALTVELPDLPPVDLGFQVFNLTTYPHLVGLLRELKVDTAVSDMSFACSVQAPGGARRFEWASHNLLTVFPSLRSAVDQSRYRLVWDVLRFGRRAQADAPHYETVGSYVSAMGFGAVFVNAYLLPMIAAIWSVPTKTAMAMPLQSLVHFMANHHLLSTGWPPRPTWRVITNRSREYVQRIRAALRDVRVGCPISRVVERDVSGVVLQDGDGDHHRFDKVVLAVHADTALKILGRHASKEERSQLTAIRYQPNRCVLHHDKSLMPRNRRLWASWNSMGSANDEDPVTCTYWLNRLQNLPADCPDLFLTLNPARDPESVLGVYTLDHPVLDGDAVRAQGAIRQGVGSVYFAGAWLGFGFHEDGMKSAVRVVRELISVDTTPSRVVPWEMHTPSPVPHSLTSYLAMKLCAMYLRRGIRKGKLRIVLPNGNELRFGEGDDDGRHRTSAVMIVHTLDAFVRIAAQGSIGLGLAYVRGQFDVDGDGESALTDLLACNLASLTETQAWLGPFSAIAGFWAARRHLRRTKNTPEQSRENVRAHYDIGNDMYELILGSTMMYSCAEFADADDAAGDDQAMDAAQKRKLQSIMVQADLRPGHHVLEIGCGWGGMALHAARCIPSIRWTGITLSEEQKAYCDRCIAEAGLQDRIEILLVDYRRFAAEHAGQFDRVVSIEMIEGVGHENLPTYFEAIRVVLAPGGRIVLQAITIPDERYEAYRKSTDFVREHIFPGGHLPSLGAMRDASRDVLRLVSLRSIGPHYAKTLRLWRRAMSRSTAELSRRGYGARHLRTFTWYFLYCESAFKFGCLDTVQAVYEPRFTMRPGVFTGHVRHERLVGASTSFTYPVVMALVDVHRGANSLDLPRLAPVSFNRPDHVGEPDRPLGDCIAEMVERELGWRPDGPIYLLTTLRGLGYSFNPISVYYVPRDAELGALVLEVTNTPWLERHCYAVDARRTPMAGFEKRLHVSPFFGMRFRYDLRSSAAEDHLQLNLSLVGEGDDDVGDDAPAMVVSLDLWRATARGGGAGPGLWLRMAMQPWVTQLWIHRQALWLLASGQPLHKVAHPAYEGRGAWFAGARYAADAIKHLFIFAVASLYLAFLRLLGDNSTARGSAEAILR